MPTFEAIARRSVNTTSSYTLKKELRHMTTAKKKAGLPGNKATIRAIHKVIRLTLRAPMSTVEHSVKGPHNNLYVKTFI